VAFSCEASNAELGGFWGFGQVDIPTPRGGSTQIFTVPHWFLAVLLAVLPASWAWPRLRAREWSRSHRCTECGYDLRATPGRCPECGAAAGESSDFQQISFARRPAVHYGL